jgi:hypothetical protein
MPFPVYDFYYQALRLDQSRHPLHAPGGHHPQPPPLAARPPSERERRKFVSFTVDLDRTGGPLGISLASKVVVTQLSLASKVVVTKLSLGFSLDFSLASKVVIRG